MSITSVLSISHLTVKFGGLTALDDVFLDIAPNTIVGLIGPNGAGKTTIFNSISGLVAPTSGDIAIQGKEMKWPASHELASMGISRTLQGVGLFSGLTVIENVMMGADHTSGSNFFKDLLGLSGRAEAKLRRRAIDALAWAGALDLAAKMPGELTYPESKRVSVARALVSNPRLLLLDEPAAGLGQDDIDKFAALLLQLKQRCAIVIVEHHVDFIGAISDQVYVLNFGKVIASGAFDTVKRDPAVLAAYLGTTQQSGSEKLGDQSA
ncbi:LivG ABC-type branched-chain amino acid transport systems, ATPase component [Candidatus Planktophila dulcis]|uniref:ABC transporter ATP-binding protein n=1 Tax=Candidatus Planktophila dulcis TaxID=1884914 RepID=UPI003BEEB6B4